MSSHRPLPLPFPCHECEDRFQTENERERHRMQRHRGSFVVGICLLCGDLSKSKFDFRDHFQHIHRENYASLITKVAQRMGKSPDDIQNQMWIIAAGFKPIDSEEVVMDSIFSVVDERMELMGIGVHEEEIIVVEKEVASNDQSDEIKNEPDESESIGNQPKQIGYTAPPHTIKSEADESESTENQPNEMGPTDQSQTDEIKTEEIDETETIENNEPFPFSSLSPIREFPATLGDEKPTSAATTSPNISPSTSEGKKSKEDESKISKVPSSMVTEATSLSNFTAKIDDVAGISQSKVSGNGNNISMADNLPEGGEVTHATTGHLKESSKAAEAKNEITSSISRPLKHKKYLGDSEVKGEPARKKSKSMSVKKEGNLTSSTSVIPTAATVSATLKTILDAEIAAAAAINSKAPPATNSLSPIRELSATLGDKKAISTSKATPLPSQSSGSSSSSSSDGTENNKEQNPTVALQECEVSSTSVIKKPKGSMLERVQKLTEAMSVRSNEKILCPECEEAFHHHQIWYRHITEKHYDVYYYLDRNRTAPNWMYWKLGGSEYMYRRVCLHCVNSKEMYYSRKELLSHIKKEHPTEFDNLQREYAEVAAKGGKIDEDVHKILISPATSTPPPSQSSDTSSSDSSDGTDNIKEKTPKALEEIEGLSTTKEPKESMEERAENLHKLMDHVEKDAKIRDLCPECGVVLHGKNAILHITEKHYDVIYTDWPTGNKAEEWVHCKLGDDDKELPRYMRVCLYCVNSKRMHNKRKGLLSHIKKEHPIEFGNLQKEYAEVTVQWGIVDQVVHEILMPSANPELKNKK